MKVGDTTWIISALPGKSILNRPTKCNVHYLWPDGIASVKSDEFFFPSVPNGDLFCTELEAWLAYSKAMHNRHTELIFQAETAEKEYMDSLYMIKELRTQEPPMRPETPERERLDRTIIRLIETKSGFYPIGGWLFMKDGKAYDLSAADLDQIDRIEREGLFLASPEDVEYRLSGAYKTEVSR